ncbi:hypothetical protein IWX90DRAFT_517780 [Phyllosticta citrichinensis]|uniref:Uncharacterized protein n=1 Tax=Phyllosticta citrichinensis TaxID=1130410 RepID=A0ABR1XEV6_9PEZI
MASPQTFASSPTPFSLDAHFPAPLALILIFFLPPGAWPLIGPLPQFISAAKAHRLHLLVEQWIREYGKEEGLVRVRIAGVEVVHVGKDEAVKAIFDKAARCFVDLRDGEAA